MMKRVQELWDLLVLTWERFSSVEGSEAAAAIAYYALFSLFPLLLVMTVTLSSTFDDPTMYPQIMSFVQQFFPGSEVIMRKTMDQIISTKGTSFWSWGGAVGFGFLLWSASSVFAGIIQNINQAWHTSIPRHFVLERVLAMGMISVLLLFFGISVFVSTGLKFYLQWLNWQTTPNFLLPFQSETAKILLRFLPLVFTFCGFILMYRFIPNTAVLWKEAAWGALFSTIAGEMLKSGFVWWYVFQGASSFLGLYGGMSAMAVLMLWLYLFSLIILFGANLSASIAYSNRIRPLETGTP